MIFTNALTSSVDLVSEIHGGVTANAVKCQVLNGDRSIVIMEEMSCDSDPALFVKFECDGNTMKATLRLDKVLYPTFFLNCTNADGLSYTVPLDPAGAVDVIEPESYSPSKSTGFNITLKKIAAPDFLPASFPYLKVIETFPNGTIKERIDYSPVVNSQKTSVKSNLPLNMSSGKIVEVELQVISNVGYQQTIRREILHPVFEVVSSKRAFLVSNSISFDSLHNVTMKITYTKNFIADYINEFFVDRVLMASTAKTEFQFNPPSLEACYLFQMKVKSSVTLSYISPSSITKCVKPGITMAVEFERGQSVGRLSTFEISLNVTRNHSCIALDFGDGNVKVFKESGAPDSICSSRNVHLPGATFITQPLKGVPLIQTSHAYASNGTYTARAIAMNDVHSQIEDLTITVLELQCTSPVTELLGEWLFILLNVGNR